MLAVAEGALAGTRMDPGRWGLHAWGRTRGALAGRLEMAAWRAEVGQRGCGDLKEDGMKWGGAVVACAGGAEVWVRGLCVVK